MEVKIINIDKKIDCEHMLGKYLTEDDADILVEDEAVDVYGPKGVGQTENDESNLICCFRPNAFNQAEIQEAYEGLREGASESTNRGISGGLNVSGLDHRRRELIDGVELFVMGWLKDADKGLEDPTLKDIQDKVEWAKSAKKAGKKFGKINRGKTWQRKRMDVAGYSGMLGPEFFQQFIKSLDGLNKHEISQKAKDFWSEFVSSTETATSVLSGIGGYFGRYPRIPYCRTTAFTASDASRWDKCITYIKRTDDYFRKLIPGRYDVQKKVAEGYDSRFRIGDTAFTTVTINANFQTACHRDAGDLEEGFGNLTCTGKGEWDGGYTIMPEYRVGVKLKPGDLLLANVSRDIHGNTPYTEKGTGKLAEFSGSRMNMNVNFERISLVCYLRRNMIECGSYEYELLREKWVKDLAADESRPEHAKYGNLNKWNGIFPGMWESDEWVHVLRSNGFDDEANKIQPEASNTLESFF